jgi:hypothetical protein
MEVSEMGTTTREVYVPLDELSEGDTVCVNVVLGDDRICSVVLYRGYSDTLHYEIIESANPDIVLMGDYDEYFDATNGDDEEWEEL